MAAWGRYDLGRLGVSVAARVVWYRFRTTLRRRWRGYASLAALIALVGGIAMASLAGARRTQSSFPAFWASTHPSDLSGATGVLNPAIGQVAYNPVRLRQLSLLPHVRRVASQAGLDVLALGADGNPLQLASLPPAPGNGYGSIDGLGFDQDRLVVLAGRLPDPQRPDEFAASPDIARQLGVRVGQTVPYGVYTNAQTNLPGFGTAAVAPQRRSTLTLVGIVNFNTGIVADESDQSSEGIDIFTPAFTRPLLACCANYVSSGVQVDRARNVGLVQSEIAALLPRGFPAIQPAAGTPAKAERAVKPEAIALAAFGVIAALAALLIACQVIGRQLRVDGEDRAVLQAVGASPAMAAGDGLVGIAGAVIAGSLLAAFIAVAVSPMFPLGPVRRFEPGAALNVDWTVVAGGTLVLVLTLGCTAALLAYRAAPHRSTARRQHAGTPASNVAGAAARAGLPPEVVTGVRFALEPGARGAAPVRSAITGTALAIVVLVATLTFGASLHTLVSRPALYGWNWDYALVAGGGSGDIPSQQVTRLLGNDPDVGVWSAAYLATLSVDGQPTPVIAQTPGAAVGPAVLSGHAIEGPDEIALGPVTLAGLHKRVGDTLSVSGGQAARSLRVVGTVSLPAVQSSGLHMEMASGAAVPEDLLSATNRNPFNDPLTGPNLALVRLRSGVDRSHALARLNAIATATGNTANFGVAVVPVQRPAEIVNYRSMGTTPAVLGAGLALGAAVALGFTLVASVRRRRRDLAILKSLGFTRRQIAAAVAWQSTVAVAIGTAVGVPIGVALGRWLWDAFARDIHAVPAPVVPATTLAVVVAGALLLANVVAAGPGREAARTPVALVLRAE
jgi:hypothetical protein